MLGVLFALITVLSLGAGCGQSSEQDQALEEERQRNEELQQALEDQEQEREEAERQEEAEEREELQRENEELQEELEAQEEEQDEGEPQDTNEPESESPDAVIESNEDWTAPPSQAPQGVVVVAPEYDVQAVTTDEAQALDAAIAYYQAVEIGDYYTTHSLLSVDDQAIYPVDTWVAANTNLDSAAGEFVVTDAYPDDVGNNSPTYAVTVAIYLPDGSSSYRTTNFTNEGNGYWAHWLTGEEIDLFNSAL